MTYPFGVSPEAFAWENARGEMGGLPAYVRLNATLKAGAPHPGYGAEVSATIEFNSAGENGMPTVEADLIAVDEIEDQIKLALERTGQTVLALVVTHRGCRRLVFYSGNPRAAIITWEQELAPRLTSHAVHFDVRPDPAWESFLAFV